MKIRTLVMIYAFIAILLIILGTLNFGYVKAKWRCRPIQWQKTMKVALQRPYLGWGYRSFNKEVAEIKEVDMISSIEFRRAHNDPLHTAQELGFPIVIVFILFLSRLFKRFRLKESKSRLTYCLFISVIIILINMTGQTLIRYASIAAPFVVILALLTIKLGEENS